MKLARGNLKWRMVLFFSLLASISGADTSWTNQLGSSGGSGGPTSGIHFITIAGQPARMVIGQGYQHAKPTFLAFYLHSDGGEYGTTDHDSFVMTNGWVYISPRCPPGTSNTNMFTWDARFGGSQAANVAQIKAALGYMITNFNVYTNFYFGAGASGGSWFYDYYGTSFTSHPAYFILNCGASQLSSAQAPSAYVRANSEFMYAIGTRDFLYPNALTSVPAYTNAGYSVLTDYMLGVDHCGFTIRAKTTNYWAGVLRRKSGACELFWRPNVLQLLGHASTNRSDIIYGTNCAWTATTTSSWITIMSGGTGSVSTNVSFRFSVNTGELIRVGSIVAGGKSLTVQQKRLDDPYETNNTRATAYDVSAAKGLWLSSWNGPGIHCDNDYYKIRLDAPYLQVNAEIVFTNSLGDLNLYLYNEAGSNVASSTSISNREMITYMASTSGTYYLLVFLYNSGGSGNCQTYDLRWSDNTPTNVQFAGLAMSSGAMFAMHVVTSTGRLYTVQSSDALVNPIWSNLPGLDRIPGLGTNQVFNTTGEASNRYFRFFHEAP